MAIDPICGMSVDESSPLRAEHAGQTYFFCSEHCRKKFMANPGGIPSAASENCCGQPSSMNIDDSSTRSRMYTCPMDPEVIQDHPGSCPKCGMALEPMTATPGAHTEDNAELHDMTLRFWVGAVLTMPVF